MQQSQVWSSPHAGNQQCWCCTGGDTRRDHAGAALSIISPGKNICCSHTEALKPINVSLEALCCDDGVGFKHHFNCINPPSSDNIHERGLGDLWHSGTQWKPEWSPSAASLSKQLERMCRVARKRLPEGSRCSFIRFCNMVLYIQQKCFLCHQRISYRINDSFFIFSPHCFLDSLLYTKNTSHSQSKYPH